MRFSEAKGRKVVSSSTAETVGKVKGFVVDPTSRSVVALRLRKADGEILRWRDLTAFGADAVTISGADRIVEQDDAVEALTGKDHTLLGKRVLTADGDEVGEVADVDFEAASGAITTLVIAGRDDVEGSRILGVGAYAVVVGPS